MSNMERVVNSGFDIDGMDFQQAFDAIADRFAQERALART